MLRSHSTRAEGKQSRNGVEGALCTINTSGKWNRHILRCRSEFSVWRPLPPQDEVWTRPVSQSRRSTFFTRFSLRWQHADTVEAKQIKPPKPSLNNQVTVATRSKVHVIKKSSTLIDKKNIYNVFRQRRTNECLWAHRHCTVNRKHLRRPRFHGNGDGPHLARGSRFLIKTIEHKYFLRF